jgi:Glycosyl hydrolase family 71
MERTENAEIQPMTTAGKKSNGKFHFRSQHISGSLCSFLVFLAALFAMTDCASMQAGEVPLIPPRQKMVAAHFMHQMSIGAECNPGEGTLAFTPSLPNDTMAGHLPEVIQNYRDPVAAARQDIALAEGCGVDTFFMLLSPGHLPKSQFTNVIRAYWQTALEQNGTFKMAVDIWQFEPNPENIAKLRDAMMLLKKGYEGAWRQYQGRLVVLLNCKEMKAEDLEKLFSGIGGRGAVFLVLYDPVDLEKSNPGLFAQANAFVDWPHSSYVLAKEQVELGIACARKAGKEYWSPAMPSFAQSRDHGDVRPNVREKLGAVNYLMDWHVAMSEDSPVVDLETWNDLTEDSAVMPETNHGYAFYELTRLCSQWYLAGRPPDITKEQVFVFHHPQALNVALPVGREPEKAFPWEMKTPPTDYVNVVTALKKPARVSVMFGEKVIAEKECVAGIQNWLIYHPSPLSAPGSYPESGKSLDCTVLNKAFGDAEVYIMVSRNNHMIGLYRSHRPILGAAGRGEMTTVGDVFNLN